jgi:hypothetical protein
LTIRSPDVGLPCLICLSVRYKMSENPLLAQT